jgi:hypothetical protein
MKNIILILISLLLLTGCIITVDGLPEFRTEWHEVDGLHTEWHDNGQKKAEGNYKNGKVVE